MTTPKKTLGQHWLFDTSVLADIVRVANIEPGDHVVEIGPGLGTLTEVLLNQGAHVLAVEFDMQLYEKLSADAEMKYGHGAKRLTIKHQDILKFNFADLPPDYKVVANIPYYLTSNLVRVLSVSSNRPKSATLLIQKEVAERLCAAPGGMSLLSVWAQMYFECSLGPVVLAKYFTPPPKVDSQVVHMKRREEPLYGDLDTGSLKRVVKAGFSNKRKTLHNSLAAGLHISKNQSAELINSINLPLTARPQELSLAQWIELSSKI